MVREIRDEKEGMVAEDYCFVIQEIEHEEEEEPRVRFGYYRMKPGSEKYRWASQTTFHTEKSHAENLIKKAVRKGILEL